MARKPFTGSGRRVELNGKLATWKQDFNAHWQGGGYRHKADQINMNPALSGGLAAADVQTTLEKFENYLVGLSVITIGDGYTTTGDFTINTATTPTIEDAFTQALATNRLSRGGWILMKSGVYDFTDTVTLPPGICVMGSVGGTIMNVAASMAGTGRPMFSINATVPYQFGIKTSPPAVDYDSDGYFKNKFVNLTFTDNMNDITTYQPALDSSTAAFFRVRNDSYLEIEKCTILGKTKYGTTAANSLATSNFVKLIDTTPPTFGNTLKIHDCVIHGVEKVVDFAANQTMDNKFTFTNNRVWFFDSSASTTVYGITYTACDSKLVGNNFKFTPINSSNLTVVPVCFEVNGSPTNVVNISVENNSLDSGLISDDETNQLLRFDTPLSTVSGANKRFSIHGNLTGNISDREWYLVVGDGENSLGDVNGGKALNYLSNIYSNLFNTTLPTGVNYNDQLTVYIRPGFYIIDSGFNSNGLGTKLIGLVENGNIPRIQILNPTDAAPVGITLDANATNVLLGTHLENLNIQHRTAAYVRLVSMVGLDNPSSYESYSERYIVKNCTFLNCGLYPRTLTSMGAAREEQAKLLIEGCRFYTFTGVLYDKQHSIIFDQSKISLTVRDCVWETSDGSYDFHGYAITNKGTWSGDTDESNLTIENCNVVIANASGLSYIAGEAAPIDLENIKNLKIKNCLFDISSTTFDFDYIIYSSNTNASSIIQITDNKFIGADSGMYTSETEPQIAVVISHNFNELNVLRNIFEDNPFALHLTFSNITALKVPYVAKISENVYDSGVKGDMFCYVRTTSPVVNNPGNIIVTNNTLKYDSQVATSVLEASSLAGMNGAIKVWAINSNSIDKVQIIGNNISDYKASANVTVPQAAILVNAIKHVTIIDNTIEVTDIINHNVYGIACIVYILIGFVFTYVIKTNSTCKIRGNDIYMDSANITATDCIATHVRNYNFVSITENTMIANNLLTSFVNTYSDPAYPNLMDGIIKNNIFNKSLDYGITTNVFGVVSAETFREEIVLHDTNSTYDTRIAAKDNKNQKSIIDINCTDFKTYGLEEMDGYKGPFLMMSEQALVAGANGFNMIKLQGQQILETTAGPSVGSGEGNEATSTLWSGLPVGMYITNTWRSEILLNNGDPMMEESSGPLIRINHYQNQLIIPVNIPYGTEIIGVDIPIYYYNVDAVNAVTVKTSAALIFGNYVNDTTISSGNGYNYIPDPSIVAAWALRISTIVANAYSNIRLTSDILSNGDNLYKNEAWINRAAGANSYGIPIPNAYILLALNRTVTGSVLEYDRALAYAIPYARVIVRY